MHKQVKKRNESHGRKNMSVERLRHLLSNHVPYQVVDLDGEVLHSGMRECRTRWEMIRRHIKHNAVIVDVGSDVGYFTVKMAEEFKDSLIISVEQAEHACQIQKELLKLKKLSNVVLCWHKMDPPTLKGLDASVEAIDTFLILAVFHHFPLDTIRKDLFYYSRIAPELIVEVPEFTGDTSGVIPTHTQYSHFDRELKKYYQHVQVIGETMLSPRQKRVTYKAWNTHLLREKLASTFVFLTKECQEQYMNRRHKLEYVKGKWILNDGKTRFRVSLRVQEKAVFPWITGFSAWTLLYWKPIYPEPEWWQRQAVEAYEKLLREDIAISDIRPFNLLVTPNGMAAIDYAGSIKAFNVERARAEIEKVRRVFENMDRFAAAAIQIFQHKKKDDDYPLYTYPVPVKVINRVTKQPRIGVIVEVLQNHPESDATVIDSAITDEEGIAYFDLPLGPYYIRLVPLEEN